MRKKLDPQQQVFVVKELACFRSPSQVVEAVKEEFGFEISRQLVRLYNPEQNPKVSKKHRELFEKTRDEFIKTVSRIGVSHQAYRLAGLQRLIVLAEASRNGPLAAQLYEQAAKESGGLYTNKRTLEIDPRKALAEFIGCDPNALPAPSDSDSDAE